MKKILVALDGSKNSLRGLSKAMDIAREEHSKIIGLNIVELPLSDFVKKPKITIKEEILKSSKKIMEIAKRKCSKAGIDFEFKIIPGGDAAYDIVKFAKKYEVNIIVVGARGLNPVKDMFLGSVSNYVLHKSKIPVLIVK